jgi:secreted PhoX family phosphatase
LALVDLASADTRNWSEQTVQRQTPMAVRWVDLQGIESPGDDLRQQGASAGAAIFARGEGAWADGDAIYFACTNGGPAKSGQVFRYLVSPEEATPAEATPAEGANPGRLELFAESPDSRLLEYGDNLTVSPWGDIIVCEDGSGRDHIVGITAKGQFYQLGRNAMDDGEFAGSTFSPDGSTLFVNLQSPGLTYAITGPWRSRPA